MLHQAAVLAVTVKSWLMLHAILQGSAHNGFTVDDTVGLGDNAAIDGARLMVTGGSMVFGSIGNEVDLIIAEPLE